MEAQKLTTYNGWFAANADKQVRNCNYDQNSDGPHDSEREEAGDYSLRVAIAQCLEVCQDETVGPESVERVESILPESEDPLENGFLGWKILLATREALIENVGRDNIDLSTSLSESDKKPSVDDDAIRKSAGYGSADERTDKEFTRDIKQFEISKSLRDDRTFRDNFTPSPGQVFISNAEQLFLSILNKCTSSRFLDFDVAKVEGDDSSDAGFYPDYIDPADRPERVFEHIQELIEQIQPPEDKDNRQFQD